MASVVLASRDVFRVSSLWSSRDHALCHECNTHACARVPCGSSALTSIKTTAAPNAAAKRQKTVGLFRGGIAAEARKAAAEAPLMLAGPSTSAADSAPAPAVDSEIVTDEVNRWLALSQDKINSFIDDEGMLNEFALLYDQKDLFPLHFIVFKQVRCSYGFCACTTSHPMTIFCAGLCTHLP